jgi:hypothetical protein
MQINISLTVNYLCHISQNDKLNPSKHSNKEKNRKRALLFDRREERREKIE